MDELGHFIVVLLKGVLVFVVLFFAVGYILYLQ